MNAPPFGLSQYTTLPLSFREDLQLCRELGIQHIEICESKLRPATFDRDIGALQDSLLNVSSVQPRYHSPFPNSLRPRPTAPRERMAQLRKTIRWCGRLFPGTTLVLNTGLAPGGDVAGAYAIALREFRQAAACAGDHGVRLAIEPLHPVYMNTDTFLWSLAEGVRMVGDVGHPGFGLLLDVWHFWQQPDATELIRSQGRAIFGVHISDWRMPRAAADRLLPGDGEIPLVPLLRTIRQAGYAGVYSLEIFSDRKLRDSLWRNPRRAAARGQQAFAKIWRTVCA